MHIDALVVLLLSLGAAASILLAGRAAHRAHRRARAARTQPPVRSAVHVLLDDRELQEAIVRAAHFEQLIADQVHARTNRYASWIAPEALAPVDPAPQPSASPPAPVYSHPAAS